MLKQQDEVMVTNYSFSMLKKIFSFLSITLVTSLIFAAQADAKLVIQHWQTKNGARVYFVEQHALPMLDLQVEFKAGSAYDSAQKQGVAYLVNQLLNKGAGSLSEAVISQQFADVGAEVRPRFDQDRAGLGLRTLSSPRERQQSLRTFQTILTQPQFDATILEREKQRLIEKIQEAQTQPDYIAGRQFMMALYPNHPYRFSPNGDIQTLKTIQAEDLKQFYRDYYTANHAVISMMGDLTRQEAEQLAEQLSQALPTRTASFPVLPAVTPPEKGQTISLDHPSQQSHIHIGFTGLKRNDPDYFPLFVGNYILGGGGFVSRLMEEIREKRGYAYSVHSYFAPLQELGIFEIGMQTKRTQTKAAVQVAHQVLKNFIEQGPTAAELETAKQNLIGGFPLRIDSNKKIAEYLAVIGFYQLPLTYLDDFTKNIEKVTVKDIHRAFKQRLPLDRFTTVVVGEKI